MPHRIGQPDVPYTVRIEMVGHSAEMTAAGFTLANGAWTKSAPGVSGCDRIARPGMLLTRCRKVAWEAYGAPSVRLPFPEGCPECCVRDFIAQFRPQGANRVDDVVSATITHWPGTDNEIVDDLLAETRVSGVFAPPVPLF